MQVKNSFCGKTETKKMFAFENFQPPPLPIRKNNDGDKPIMSTCNKILFVFPFHQIKDEIRITIKDKMNQYGVNDDVTKSIDKVQEEVRDYVIIYLALICLLTLQREELGFYQISLQQHSSFFAFTFVAIVLLYYTFW